VYYTLSIVTSVSFFLSTHCTVSILLLLVHQARSHNADYPDYKPGPGRCTNVLRPLAMELARMCWTGIMTLRTWALWRQNRLVSRLLCVIGPAFAALTIISIPLRDAEYRGRFGLRKFWLLNHHVLIYDPVSGRIHWNPERAACVSTGYAAPWTNLPAIVATVYMLFLTGLTTFRCLQYVRLSSNGPSFFSPNLVR
jgi:hypothetical protein